MKKIATTIFILSMVFCWVQNVNAQCVQCDSTINTGEHSTTLGKKTTASDFASFASGYEVSSTNAFSFAHGKFINCSGTNSFALGSYLDAIQQHCFVLGHGYNNDNHLENNISYSLMIGFNSSRATFFVGKSKFGATSTGRIGIGDVTEPQAKLHIRADDNYYDTASVFIQEMNDNKDAWLWLGNQNFGLRKHNSVLEFLSAESYQFNGNVGIGTDDPKAKVHVKDGDIFIEDIDHGIVMKSPNGSCWRGTVTDEGQLQFTQVDCDELTVSTPETEPVQNYGIRIYPNPTGNRVTVEIPAENSGAVLSIKSSDGKQLATTSLTGTSNPVDMSSYPAGVYFFYISLDGKLLEVKKVVKE